MMAVFEKNVDDRSTSRRKSAEAFLKLVLMTYLAFSVQPSCSRVSGGISRASDPPQRQREP